VAFVYDAIFALVMVESRLVHMFDQLKAKDILLGYTKLWDALEKEPR